MKRIFLTATVICLFFAHVGAQAEIYKSVDADGRVTYSNVRTKGSKKLDLGIVETASTTNEKSNNKSNNSSKTATLSGYPKVDNNTQNQRDNKRREILFSELNQEKQSLDKAKQDYEDAKNTPEVYKTANGKTFRNVAKYEEKLQSIQDQISAHERNIELLNKELSQ